VPQHDYAIVYDDQHITTWQTVLSLSISEGSVSHIIWHLWYLKMCVMGSSQALSQIHNWQKSPFFWVTGMWPSYPRLLHKMKPRSIILDWRQKTTME
jgi:hypothetical protein